MVVLGHLLELRVLHDLQHPEADGEDREHDRDRRTAGRDRRIVTPPAIFSMRCHIQQCYRRRRVLRASRRSTAPGRSSTSWNATTPTTALRGRLPGHRRIRRPELPQVEQHVQPHEHDRVQHGRAEKHDEPRQRLRDDELRADDAGQKPDDRLRQPADADDAASTARPAPARRTCRSAARSPARTSARRRPRRPAPGRPRPCCGSTNRASVVCSARATATATRMPAALTRTLPRPASLRRRRRQHDQHFFERSRNRPPA